MMIRVPRSTLAGSCPHQVDDLVEGRVVEPVDLVVEDRDLTGRDGVDVDEGPQDAVDEDGAALAHLGQLDVVGQSGGSGASLRTCLATEAAWSPIRSSS